MKYFVLVILLGIPLYANDNCLTKDGIPGSCKSFVDCPYLYNLIQNTPLPDILKQYGGCGERNGDTNLCCPVSSTQTTYSVTSTSSPVTAMSSPVTPTSSPVTSTSSPVSVLNVQTKRPKCKDGWLYFEDSCYLIGQEFLDWHAGGQQCLSMGSDYVKITSDAEFRFLLRHITHDTWIGMNDLDVEADFFWVSDNSPAPIITRWFHPREPNDLGGIEDCIGFYYLERKFLLNDAVCERPNHKYICEMKPTVIFV